MNITIGKSAGFCFGVKRAVQGAEEEVVKEKQTYCLGEIVHNKQVVSNLKKLGIIFVDEINQVTNKNKVMLIRAHGITKGMYEEAQKLGIVIRDYTCPNVLKIHKIASNYAEKRILYHLSWQKNSSRKYWDYQFLWK